MAHQKPLSEQKKALAEQLWLIYLNNTVYQQGLITAEQRNRIRHMIECRSCPPNRGKR